MTDTNPPAERVAEIRARLDNADTPGPWEIEPDEHGTRLGSKTSWVGICPDCGTTAEFDSGDADLIANAPQDLAWLLGYVGELETQLAAVRAIHQPGIGGVQVGRMQIRQVTACERCQVIWPCEDAKALGLGEEPTPGPKRAPDSEMDPFEAADDIYRRWE